MVAYISPICREGQAAVDTLVSMSFILAVEKLLERYACEAKNDEFKNVAQKMLEKLKETPIEFFKYYWEENSQYYT